MMEYFTEAIVSLHTHYSPLIQRSALVFEQQGKNRKLSLNKQFTIFISSVEVTRTLVKEGVDYYDYLMSLGDERVENWGLMYSPVPTILITTAYLLSKSDNRKIDN